MNNVITKALRCVGCNKKLAERVTPPYLIICPRCHRENKG